MPLDHYTPRVGIMRDVRFGKQEPYNHYEVGLSLRLDTGTGWMTNLFLSLEDTVRVINGTRVTDVQKLNDWPCYYTIENGIVRFKGPVVNRLESKAWPYDGQKAHEEWEWMLELQRKREEAEK